MTNMSEVIVVKDYADAELDQRLFMANHVGW